MIKKYLDFKINNILESIIEVKPKFLSILKLIEHEYASLLIDIINNKKDIKTSFNGLDVSYRKDKINFIPDSQFQRADKNKFDKKFSEADIGRLVRSILISDNQQISDNKLEEFVNLFKANWENIFGDNLSFGIVKGDNIKYWYNGKRYSEKKGTLYGSCMKYENCQEYMGIYVKNPEVCQLVIITQSNILLARALLWELDNGDMYLDKPYYSEASYKEILKSWVISKFKNKKIIHYNQKKDRIRVKLKISEFEYYPYIDTLSYLVLKQDGGKIIESYLTNENEYYDVYLKDEDFDENKVIIKLNSLEGKCETITHNYSKKYNKWLVKADSIWADSIKDYAYRTDFDELTH